MQTALDVEQKLQAGRWRLRMNYAALAAALTLDMGFTPRQHYLFSFPAFLAGMQPCFIEASVPAGSLMPLSCDDINYQGRRRVPGPLAARSGRAPARRAHDPPEAGRWAARCPEPVTARGCPRRTRCAGSGQIPSPGTGRMPQREVC